EGDSVHLTNVVYNLLDNALKYSPTQPEIQISLRQANGQVLLSVQDNGVGIPEEYRKKIFEQFFRVPQEGQRHNTKGYGLGLSYVAEVLRRHAGHIEVDSTPAQGSLFTVTLPKTQPSK
ncbi:MAG: sensor histidine kinase, partial [Haliscomenobacter sp.]